MYMQQSVMRNLLFTNKERKTDEIRDFRENMPVWEISKCEREKENLCKGSSVWEEYLLQRMVRFAFRVSSHYHVAMGKLINTLLDITPIVNHNTNHWNENLQQNEFNKQTENLVNPFDIGTFVERFFRAIICQYGFAFDTLLSAQHFFTLQYGDRWLDKIYSTTTTPLQAQGNSCSFKLASADWFDFQFYWLDSLCNILIAWLFFIGSRCGIYRYLVLNWMLVGVSG